VPLNAARKKRARQFSRATGLPYTASLGLLERRPELAGQLLWTRSRLEQFGHPVAIVTDPVLPGPWFAGGSSYNDRPYEIRLGYGRFQHPELRILTRYALPGRDLPESRLRNALVGFVAATSRASAPAERGGREAALAARADFVGLAGALDASCPEQIDIRWSDRRVAASRLCLEDFEAVEIALDDVSIVCCGRRGLADTVRLDFEVYRADAQGDSAQPPMD
jgi:hypothetical protein